MEKHIAFVRTAGRDERPVEECAGIFSKSYGRREILLLHLDGTVRTEDVSTVIFIEVPQGLEKDLAEFVEKSPSRQRVETRIKKLLQQK